MQNRLLFSTLIACLVLLSLNGQNFLPDLASWTLEVYSHNDHSSSTYHIKYFLGDTTNFNGKEYRIIRSKPAWQDTFGFVREQGNKVFMRLGARYERLHDSSQSREFLVYNFDLNVGDTIPLRLYNRADTPTIKNLNFHVIQVDSVNTISGKRMRMRLLQSNPDTGWYAPRVYLRDTITWIQGIGSPFSPFYNIHVAGCFNIGLFDRTYHTTTCHSKNGKLLYQPFGACQNISVKEFSEKQQGAFYPNPAGDKLHIKQAAQLKSVTFYNLQGQAMKRISRPQSTIEVDELKKGVYILQLTSTDKQSFTQKLIIN